MEKSLRVFLLLCLASSFQGSGLCEELNTQRSVRNPVSGIAGYTSVTPRLGGLTLEIPSNWRSSGELFANWYDDTAGVWHEWSGPASSQGVGSVRLTLYAIPVWACGSERDTLEKNWAFLKQMKIEDKAQIPYEGTTTIAARTAYEAVVRYPVKRDFKHRALTGVFRKDAWVFTQNGEYYIELTYSAEEPDFETYREAFERAKNSLRTYHTQSGVEALER